MLGPAHYNPDPSWQMIFSVDVAIVIFMSGPPPV